MRGYVPTPTNVVDEMVKRLFYRLPPKDGDRLLDAGCGEGAFISGVVRYCKERRLPLPIITGIEQDPARARAARSAFSDYPSIEILTRDFLRSKARTSYRYIVSNPPYIGLASLTGKEKKYYRANFRAAQGRFDLYMLFFEKALNQLDTNGRLVFITPEKWLYVESAKALRAFISQYQIEAVHFEKPNLFPGLTTYPTIAQIRNKRETRRTRVIAQDGSVRMTKLADLEGESWLGRLNGASPVAPGTISLVDYCERISAGVATGADDVFVFNNGAVPKGLERYTLPAVAGKDLRINSEPESVPSPSARILMPYDRFGDLLSEKKLGRMRGYLEQPRNKERLVQRSCVDKKPWYAFHDSVPLEQILKPKILCKDITERPRFWIDHDGDIVPKHSVYYIVPKDPGKIRELADWLNGPEAHEWLVANCQRAANNYIRLQTSVLRRLPVPANLV